MPTNPLYTDNKLVIEIATECPAATYAALLKSITSCIGYCVAASDKHTNFEDEVTPLIHLLKAILPNESDLEKIFE